MKVGDIIKVEEPLKTTLEDLNQARMDADAAFRRAAKWLRQEDGRFWGAILEKYPELKGHDFSYDEERGEILVTRQSLWPKGAA